MSVKLLDVRWFCGGHGNVGVVRVEDQYDGIKYYIGQVTGDSEEMDTHHIMNWGSTFPKDAGDVLFGVT